MSELVRMAELFAESKHLCQVDRAGDAYINHPRYVAGCVDGENEKAVAFLHDTVEDTDATVDEIRGLFGDVIADAVAALTRREHETYMDYIRRVKDNEIARKVKLADLKHNMDLTRLAVVTDEDLRRVKKYGKAYGFLSE